MIKRFCQWAVVFVFLSLCIACGGSGNKVTIPDNPAPPPDNVQPDSTNAVAPTPD